MGYNKVFLPVVGVIKRATEKAILLVVTNPEALTEDEVEIENWIPRSQTAKITPLGNGTTEVLMSEWIIEQKKLESFVSKAKSPVPTPPAIASGSMDDDIPF